MWAVSAAFRPRVLSLSARIVGPPCSPRATWYSTSPSPKPHGTDKPLHVARDLPPLKSRKTMRYVGLGVALGIWATGTALAFNHQRLSSSVVTSTVFFVRHSDQAIEALGQPIAFESGWPWISGTINQLKGQVDISFNIKGPKGSGTVFVKSVRTGHHWTDQELALRLNSGQTIDLRTDHSLVGASLAH
ncbi:cytochrome oxidase assembly protein 1 [Dimargaris xerosporica]|nr:cytochrome oxidase assembly protein 1 [Dimargaris xerosporica]